METGHRFHKDSFGQIGTIITGSETWTPRLLRSTNVSVPHIAKADVFTYKAQINHEKTLDTNLDNFHIHILPIGAVTGGEVIAIDYAWGWVTRGDVFPSTLPNTGTVLITLSSGDQYKYLIKNIVSNLAYPTGEDYSSEFFIECTRRNDGQDTYAGEFALLDGDCHYLTNHLGSYNEYAD